MRCKKCGSDHEHPKGVGEAVKILACLMPEYTFYTRDGLVKIGKIEKE